MAGFDSMLYIKELPWQGLGHKYDVQPGTTQQIIQEAKLDWTVNHTKMYTSIHEQVENYNAIYREDTNDVLGVVNRPTLTHVQNVDAFNAFADLIGKEVQVETAAALNRGTHVFGCFKISDSYKVLDDDIDHYFVVVNEHLKSDGKVTLINTPIRIVCMNTLTAALSTNCAKMRIPVAEDEQINLELARKIIASSARAIDNLQKGAEKLVGEKVTRKYIDKLLEEMFPFIEIKEGDMSMHEKANENVQMMRDTFIECMHKDDLANYNGTKYQVLQGALDFSQHYYKDASKSYELSYRMGAVLGSSDTSQPIGMMSKFLKLYNKIAA